ncbi:hypothetical protein JG688_00016597 [Phytophthora aleatoria]|uniref:Uncharacterized protein n=1 Tax=Phytophthora aleatoria TaxID=2496075 RepID=A0A8J5LYX9_9STRA|nr:hypothetical protein JG688_00016597 [Phytophthora aleatoria]
MERNSELLSIKSHRVIGSLVFVEKRSEVAAFHELQHDTKIRERIPRNANECDDVGVVQRSSQLCFREEFVDIFEVSSRSRQ